MAAVLDSPREADKKKEEAMAEKPKSKPLNDDKVAEYDQVAKKTTIKVEKPSPENKGGDPESPKDNKEKLKLQKEILAQFRLPDPVLKKYVLDKASEEELEDLKKAPHLKNYPEKFPEEIGNQVYGLEHRLVTTSMGEKVADYHTRFNIGPMGLFRFVMSTDKELELTVLPPKGAKRHYEFKSACGIWRNKESGEGIMDDLSADWVAYMDLQKRIKANQDA